MSVWLTIPSARPPEEAEKVLKLWRAQGYKIALFIDADPGMNQLEAADKALTGRDPLGPQHHPTNLKTPLMSYKNQGYVYIVSQKYPGYAQSVNMLIDQLMQKDPQAEWFVIGGDDTEPDMNHTAEEIARQCREDFLHAAKLAHMNQLIVEEDWETFGVMQPTGDRFANACIEKIAGSAWIGREFARRMYGGNGPLWPEYTRFFMDEELQAVAQRYGVFQQRPDLIHLHRHYMRESDALDAPAIRTEIPEHLKAQEAKWKEEQDIFNRRKHGRPVFPGSEPIA